MSNAKHTAGPLVWSISGDILKDNKVIGSAYTNEKDAALWAAAPKMLEALNLTGELLPMLINATPTGKERNAFCDLNIIVQTAIKKATE